MAAELVGGAFLSASLQVIFDRLASPEFLNLIRAKKLNEKLLDRLKTTLYAASAVLNDAEYKQIKDPAVKNWLDDLRDAVYVADDLLDEISSRSETQKEVPNISFFRRNSNDGEIGSKIEDITSRLESVVKHKDILSLKVSESRSLCMRDPSTSLVEASEVYGRDKDKEALINLLLDDNSDSNLSVIPIVGMGGIGKTTLAQLVYNDDHVRQNFNLKAWVCVSVEFDVSKVTKAVIEDVSPDEVCKKESLNSLQVDLKEKLMGKKFLIVLDDVWNENYDKWDLLRKPFQYGSKGSKILLTTRSERVASIVQTIPNSYHPDELSNDNCWLLFARHARLHTDFDENSNIAKIGRDIVNKCKGLPLAIKALGGLLGSNHDIEYWKTILKSDLWDLSEEESKIFPALRISYHYLLPHLKQCFAYCSLILKDHAFCKEELILLWMAEGFLQSPNTKITLEEVGSEYFDVLRSRSFFQRQRTQRRENVLVANGRAYRSYGRLKKSYDPASRTRDEKFLTNDYQLSYRFQDNFLMHDLIHDLSIFVGGEFYHNLEADNGNKIPKKTRHLSCAVANVDVALYRVEKKSLRTLVLRQEWLSYSIAPNMDKLMLSKCLRVLSICEFKNLRELPDSIGQLIHLRYLDLSLTNIESLPESLCKLYNLQTLKLEDCTYLTMLPKNMQDLVNLRYLNVSGTRVREMPRGIGKLKNLQFLSDFIISKDKGAKIRELGGLPSLGNYLGIWSLESVRHINEALEARLMDKSRLRVLFLEWSRYGDTMDSCIERDILDKLQPHSNLKQLIVKGYRGTRFPDWLGHPSYHSLVYLRLKDCRNCWMLPPLGQLPSLKELTIEKFDRLVSVGADFYKNHDSSLVTLPPFSSLESLKFECMSAWEDWCSTDIEAFPKLQMLTIRDCPKLRGDLPKQQYELYLEDCPSLLRSCIPASVRIMPD